ncbi:unnamed protein product [Rotaria sp. Silwood2]|nr:unnamed protein product [Rotaria sp. Silwood2]
MTYEHCEVYSKLEFYSKKCLEHHLQSIPNNTDETAYLFRAVAIHLADHHNYEKSTKNLKILVTLFTIYHGLENFQQANEDLKKAISTVHTLSNIDLSSI